MASASEIATPLVVKISKRERPIFKRHPFKSIEDDSEGVFSSILYDILQNEDRRAHIHWDIEELRNVDMLTLYTKHIVSSLGNLKPKYHILHDKGFTLFVHFLVFDEAEWVRYILSKIHDEFIQLEKPHNITKQAIQAVTCLSATGEIPSLRKVQNTTVAVVTGSQYVNQSMTISDIVEHDVRFTSMVVGYKVYQSSMHNSVSSTTIFTAYQMLKEIKRCDLCSILLSELLSNLKKITRQEIYFQVWIFNCISSSILLE